MNFTVTKKGRSYIAVVDGPQAVFAGKGRTMLEAIGDCLVSNREVLGATIDVVDADGTVVARSTEYCKPRKKV